ncbi:DM13 domain-containing protein [Gordonia sp. NPDC003376]
MVGGVGVVLVVGIVVGGLVFQPWLLFVDTEIDDEIPSAIASAPSGTEPVAVPVLLSQGDFISHEHDTSGAVSVIEKDDGTRVLAIKNLDTTTGPDVHVWLSAGEVIPGRDGWHTAGDAARVDLGKIKGNRGDQVYAIPADTDLAEYPAVVLWCVRFNVSFGAAELHPAA